MSLKIDNLEQAENEEMSQSLPLVYLSGPMRGYPEQNFPLFREAAFTLRKMGWGIISPAELDIENDFDPSKETVTPEQLYEFMARDIIELLRFEVKGIIMLPNWNESIGARAERTVAEALGKKVWHYHLGGEPYPCDTIIDKCHHP